MRDAGTSLWRARAMTAERHQPPDDGGFAGPCVPHDDSPASLTAARFGQDVVQTREEPVAADEGCFCGDARYLEQQRLQHDVGLFEGRQSPWVESRE